MITMLAVPRTAGGSIAPLLFAARVRVGGTGDTPG